MATKKNEAYIEFKANTSEFQKGIKAMNAELKTASNELRLNATQLKGTGDSVELLSERQEILQRELEASSKKVELTERSLAECEATLGKNSKEYESLNNAVVAAKNQQQAIQNELDQTAAKLEKVEKENKEAASAFGKLADEISEQEDDLAALKRKYADVVLEQGKSSKEAKGLAKEIDDLSNELKDNKKQLDNAEQAANKFDNTLDGLGDSAKDAGDGFTVFKGALAGVISNGFSGLVSAAGNAVSSIAGLEEETREFRAEMGKLETSFDTAGLSSTDAKNTFSELYGIMADEGAATEAAQHLAKISKGEKDLEANTRILTGVFAEYGTSIPTEGLAEGIAASSAMSSVQGVLADALEWQGVNLDTFNEKLASLSTEEERASYIQSTLTELYGESADKYRENNAEIINANKVQADYTATMAEFGEKVAPITSTVKEGFNGLLQEVLGLVDGADIEGFTASIESGFATVKDTVLPAVVEGFDKLKTAWQWLSEHTGLLVTVASVIGIVTAGITAYNVVQGIKTAMDAANVTTVWALVSAHIAQAAAAAAAVAPYILIVAAIAAVIAIIVLCVKHWDTIKEKITEVAQKVKDKVIEIKNNITEKLNAAKQKAVEIFENIKKGISDKIAAAKDKVTSTIEKLRSGFISKVEAIKSKVSSVFSSLKEKITSPVEKAKETITGIVEKIKGVFNFKWSLPKLKIPKISVSGGKAPYGIAGKGSLPKFSIQWNAKGGVFTKPTVLQGFGEAGTEYALPLNERSLAPLATLLNKMTVSGENGLAEILTSRFDRAVDRLAERLERLEVVLNLDGEQIATATAGYNDAASGTRLQLAERGLAIK